MQDDPASELPRIPLKRTSENSYSETVWKIAEGVSSTLLWRQEAADRDFFDPSWPLRSPDSGSIPNFQTVSEGAFSEVRRDRGWRTVLLTLRADLGAFLRLGLLRGALRYPHERHSQRRYHG